LKLCLCFGCIRCGNRLTIWLFQSSIPQMLAWHNWSNCGAVGQMNKVQKPLSWYYGTVPYSRWYHTQCETDEACLNWVKMFPSNYNWMCVAWVHYNADFAIVLLHGRPTYPHLALCASLLIRDASENFKQRFTNTRFDWLISVRGRSWIEMWRGSRAMQNLYSIGKNYIAPLSFTVGDSVPAFLVKLAANDLNCVDVPLNPTHSLTHSHGHNIFRSILTRASITLSAQDRSDVFLGNLMYLVCLPWKKSLLCYYFFNSAFFVECWCRTVARHYCLVFCEAWPSVCRVIHLCNHLTSMVCVGVCYICSVPLVHGALVFI